LRAASSASRIWSRPSGRAASSSAARSHTSASYRASAPSLLIGTCSQQHRLEPEDANNPRDDPPWPREHELAALFPRELLCAQTRADRARVHERHVVKVDLDHTAPPGARAKQPRLERRGAGQVELATQR